MKILRFLLSIRLASSKKVHVMLLLDEPLINFRIFYLLAGNSWVAQGLRNILRNFDKLQQHFFFLRVVF